MRSHSFIISILVQITLSQVAFVAVGTDITPSSGRSIAYSTDGTSWNLVAQNIFSTNGNGVAYSQNQNKWIAVGQGSVNTMAWSPDGITWTGLGNTLFQGYGSSVTYSPEQNRWVAVGQAPNSIYYSTDGFTWTVVTPNIFSGAGTMVTYSSSLNQWVAVGWGTNIIATSSDGMTWTGLGNIVFPFRGFSVAFANGVYVATGGDTVTQAWSSNGVTWTTTPEFISNARHQAVYAKNRWLMVGPPPVNIQNSTDGKSWSNKTNPLGVTDLYAIVYNPAYDRYVAMGTGTNNIIYSSDGDTWNVASNTSTLLGTDAWKVATTGRLSQIITNPTPITIDIVNFVTNTSIINSNISISVNGNFTILGDLAIDGTWILANTSIVNVSGILSIKGNTTFNSLQPISCETLSISSATGASKLTIILSANLSIGNSITYPVATYKTRSGSFNDVIVQSASTDCPVATQSYSSTTLSVTVTMTRCGGNPPIQDFATNSMSTAMIVGIAVGCAVLAAAVILVVVLLMRRHRDRADAIANLNLRQASINDLKVAQNRHTPAIE